MVIENECFRVPPPVVSVISTELEEIRNLSFSIAVKKIW